MNISRRVQPTIDWPHQQTSSYFQNKGWVFKESLESQNPLLWVIPNTRRSETGFEMYRTKHQFVPHFIELPLDLDVVGSSSDTEYTVRSAEPFHIYSFEQYANGIFPRHELSLYGDSDYILSLPHILHASNSVVADFNLTKKTRNPLIIQKPKYIVSQ